MTFPPPTLPTNRTDATVQQTNHKNDHNAANLAINDIVAKMGDRWRMAYAAAGIQQANAGAYDDLFFGGTKFDPFGWVNGVNIKPDRAGYYLIVSYVDWTGTATTNTTGIEVRRNGNAVARQAQTGVANGDHTVTAVAYANGTTDVFTVSTYHNNAAAQQHDGTAAVIYIGG